MHIFMGLVFGGFLAWLTKTFGWKLALRGTVYGILSCLLVLLIAEFSYKLIFI